MLQSVSSASSAHSRQDEVLPHGEPQSSNVLPICSPPDARQDENIDPHGSSRGILMLKRWIPTRMNKSNKRPALHEPDRVPRQSDQPAEHPSRSQSPARVEDSDTGPSTMAVSAFPWRIIECGVLNISYSRRSQRSSRCQRFVVPRICMQGLITRFSINQVERPLLTNVRRKTLLVVSRVVRMQRKWNQYVYFP